jgi:hypothetical protein
MHHVPIAKLRAYRDALGAAFEAFSLRNSKTMAKHALGVTAFCRPSIKKMLTPVQSDSSSRRRAAVVRRDFLLRSLYGATVHSHWEQLRWLWLYIPLGNDVKKISFDAAKLFRRAKE